MKKYKRVMIYALFSVAYAIFFSLLTESFLVFLNDFFGTAVGFGDMVSFWKTTIICSVLGFFALLVLILLLFLNIKYSERLNCTKAKLIVQSICIFVLYVPMMNAWIQVFDCLLDALVNKNWI